MVESHTPLYYPACLYPLAVLKEDGPGHFYLDRPLRELKEMLRIIPFNYVVTETNVFV